MSEEPANPARRKYSAYLLLEEGAEGKKIPGDEKWMPCVSHFVFSSRVLLNMDM